MLHLHKEILTEEQINLLPLVRKFSTKFFMVGGTAMALHIGHRRSIDFDLFSLEAFRNNDIRRKIVRAGRIETLLVDKLGEFTITIRGVRITFFHYPFHTVTPRTAWDDVVKMPDFLTLAAMKAHALGQRAKWKDYVDLYFVMKNYYGLDEIVKKAKRLFASEFNEKIFRVQLAYFKDIDYTEKIIFMKGREIKDEVIKKALIDFSVT